MASVTCFVSDGEPNPPRRVPRFPINFERISGSQIFVRPKNDPLVTAREACGATEVTSREFRMLGGKRELRALSE